MQALPKNQTLLFQAFDKLLRHALNSLSCLSLLSSQNYRLIPLSRVFPILFSGICQTVLIVLSVYVNMKWLYAIHMKIFNSSYSFVVVVAKLPHIYIRMFKNKTKHPFQDFRGVVVDTSWAGLRVQHIFKFGELISSYRDEDFCSSTFPRTHLLV